jgi:DNA-binding beta-propeller fold protein YncE
VDAKTKEIFIVDCNNHRIQVYHLNSLAYIRQIGNGEQGDAPGRLNYAVGICMDDNKQIFVADTNNHRVVVFNRITGQHIRVIGAHGTAPGFMCSPYGVCVDMYTNILYVTDYDNHRVQAFNKDTGELVRVIGAGFGSGNGQMNQPIVVCIDYELDHLLVADYSNNRVIVFEKESCAFVRTFGSNVGAASLCGPRGLCICAEANLLFVADRENHRVQLYDKSSYQCLRSIGDGLGVNPGQFHRPMEVCVCAEEGVLLVVDGYNHRVQIMEIPELQPEKRRLRALAKSKADAELRGKFLPKPSALAVSTQITGEETLLRDATSGAWRVRFERLGPLFDVTLSQDQLPLLLSHLQSARSSSPATQNASPAQDGTVALSSSGVTASNALVLRKQAGMFLSILESLCAESGTDGEPALPYMFASPALFALHSLLDRGWVPDAMSGQVVRLLANFLSNVGDGIASEAERSKVQDAIVALLHAAVYIDSESRTAVLQAVLACLDGPHVPTSPVRASLVEAALASVSDESPQSSDRLKILLSYLDLLGALFDGDGRGRGSSPAQNSVLTRSSSRASLSASSLPTPAVHLHERRKQSLQLRDDVMEFMYGGAFMAAVKGGQSGENKVPVPGVDAATSSSSAAGSPAAMEPSTAVGTRAANAGMKEITMPPDFAEFVQCAVEMHRVRGEEQPVKLCACSSAVTGVATTEDRSAEATALQVKLLRAAQSYLRVLRRAESSAGRAGFYAALSSTTRRSRGGRNIWRTTEPLAAGDLVDAQDKEKCWFESIVQEILPDGSVRVHFMGWGSKWDDTLTRAEVATRLAPLNSKTKNWRADLFTGGLIEIKCNDDPVNQKWMWGKITALNVEEAWVEVSYLFSNEPSVVKRAWLWGETICPVGMHTKDKSKAAAATLVKPLKKVPQPHVVHFCNAYFFIHFVFMRAYHNIRWKTSSESAGKKRLPAMSSCSLTPVTTSRSRCTTRTHTIAPWYPLRRPQPAARCFPRWLRFHRSAS